MARIYSERGSSEREKEIFASNLNYHIAQSEKTQLQVAKELGFNATTLNMWCKGNSMPTSGKIQKLADYFHIDKSDLLEVPKHSSGVLKDCPERISASHNILNDLKVNVDQLVIEDLKIARALIEKQIDSYYENIK